eukprot:403373177
MYINTQQLPQTSQIQSEGFTMKEGSHDDILLTKKFNLEQKSAYQRKVTSSKMRSINAEELELTKRESLSTDFHSSDSGKSQHSSSNIANNIQEDKNHASKSKQQDSQRMSTFKLRTISTIVLLCGFFMLIAMGHFYCSLIVIPLQIVMYKEIMSIKRQSHSHPHTKLDFILQWYIFWAVEYFMIPKFFLRQLLTQDLIPQESILHMVLYDKHTLISFCLFIVGLIIFVFHLDQGSYKYQIEKLSHQIMGIIFVVIIPSFTQNNIYKGFYWLIFPQLCVVTNDVCSYLFGIVFGRTPLIQISPKKTWEGFLGVIAIYASLIAPFGGFFASGVKRAFNIKDFGNSIPGHGGLTDRFDCHGLMGIFTYFYISQVVFKTQYRSDMILEQFSLLSFEDQVGVFQQILKHSQRNL